MAVLCRSYASHVDALHGVHAVLDAGIPGEGVRVLTGEATRDARIEKMGEFAGPVGPDAPVGSFAGSHAEDEPHGAFAGGEQRGGSFADADRDVVTDYPNGVERMRVAGHERLRRLLGDAGLDDATVERDVKALHEGRVLVLVDAPDDAAEHARTALER